MKELERTDQAQSLKISETLGNSRNASISIVDNEKEIYKAYSTGDLHNRLWAQPEVSAEDIQEAIGNYSGRKNLKL